MLWTINKIVYSNARVMYLIWRHYLCNSLHSVHQRRIIMIEMHDRLTF